MSFISKPYHIWGKDKHECDERTSHTEHEKTLQRYSPKHDILILSGDTMILLKKIIKAKHNRFLSIIKVIFNQF